MKLKINIDGKEYEADIEVLEEERREPLGAGPARSSGRRAEGAPLPGVVDAGPSPSASDDKVCRSSIVGIVVMVGVKPGQDVNAGDPLLVLEAMKMESNVLSPITGRVKTVCVGPGESVKKGQILIEFE